MFTREQLMAAELAAEAARLTVLSQWMNREDAAKAEKRVKKLRQQQLTLETEIEEWE